MDCDCSTCGLEVSPQWLPLRTRMQKSLLWAMVPAVFGLTLWGGIASAQVKPVYADGKLTLPENYETWVFVGSNLGLVYKPEAHGMTTREASRADPKIFNNVYLEPGAYRTFLETGTFPDPTILIMELYLAEERDPGGVLKEGVFKGRRLAVEAAVKDSKRPTHEGSTRLWAYYAFPADADGEPIRHTRAETDSDCHDCHKRHASHDNVWTQFYPVLRRRLEK